jgi:hypothetical protein
MTKQCPYCGGKVILADSARIYNGQSYGLVYICSNYGHGCDAFVGVHKGTKRPLGTLANNELRNLRKRCHFKFDELWKSGKATRKEAYHWLHEVMELSKRQAHIAKFDVQQCEQFLKLNINDYGSTSTSNAVFQDRGNPAENPTD